MIWVRGELGFGVSYSFLILMIGTPPMIVEKVGHWAAGDLEREEEAEKIERHTIRLGLDLGLGCNVSPAPAPDSNAEAAATSVLSA